MKDRMSGIVAPMRDQPQSQAFAKEGIIKAYGDPDPEIVVFGDSHALMWSSTIDSICKELGHSVSFFAADGTPPDISDPPQKIATRFFTAEEKFFFDRARLHILNEKNPGLVILAGKYSNYSDGKNIESLLDTITRSGAKCLIIEQPPMMPFGDKNALIYCAELARKQKATNGTINLCFGEFENWRRGKLIIDEVIKKFPSASTLKIADLYQSDMEHVCLMEKNLIQYIDDDHLSENGALKAKSRIKRRVSEILLLR
jgi:hypothetical protein